MDLLEKHEELNSPDRDMRSGVLVDSLRRISRITSRIRHANSLVALLTLGNLAAAIFVIVNPRITQTNYFVAEAVMASVTCLATALLMLGVQERWRKVGEVLFEEISDELQWFAVSDKAISSTKPMGMPRLDHRIILRQFAKTTDLPLVPGKHGGAIYALVNLLVGIFSYSTVYIF